MPPTRTNPAYAHLAYQGSIIDQVVEDILERYVGNDAVVPPKDIVCSMLVQEDSIVPSDELLHFVSRLKNYKVSLDNELTRFEFVRRDDGQGISLDSFANTPAPAEPKAKKSNGKQAAKRKRRARSQDDGGEGSGTL